MNPFRKLSTSEQLVEYFQQEIINGSLSGTMPGIKQLVSQLGVSAPSLEEAMLQLEHDGYVINQGGRRKRLIADIRTLNKKQLRIGILLYDPATALDHDTLTLERELKQAGHSVSIAPKSMMELGMKVESIKKHIQSMQVDAWVAISASREVLEWLAQQPKPAFALYGRSHKLPIASVAVNKSTVITEVIHKLVELKHRRIVMLVREERRKPHLGRLEQHFINELEKHGIQVGPYNIPDWEDTPDGLQKIIDSLFEYTPPTAIIIGDLSLFHTTQLSLARRGILAPEHVSLFSTDAEKSYAWSRPEIAHLRWDYRVAVRHTLRWANLIARGKTASKKTYVKSHLYEGGTIGARR